MRKKIVGIVILFIIFVTVLFLDNGNDYTIKSVNYNGSNLRISIDGSSSNTLPTSGSYYLANYDCESDETKIIWDKNNYQLKVSNGKKKSGISCYLDFQTNPLLYYMEEGSYVEYVGNNGCPSGHCDGTNANYVSDTDMGYCTASNYKFITNGWRIAYKENGNVYLVSAGAPECMCTSGADSYSNSSCSFCGSTSCNEWHLSNLNRIALNYCNTDYVKGGVCNGNTVWAFNFDDLKKITGKDLYYNNESDNSCYNQGSSSNTNCGYNNDLIDNGSYYWIGTFVSSEYGILWRKRYVSYERSSVSLYGVRPVIKLDNSVFIVSGSGTYEDPYQIGNNTFTIDDVSLVSEGNNRNVTLNLVALDSVTQVCVNVDSSSCSNYVDFPESNTYSLDLSSYGTGEKTIYVYYKDANGKIVASMHKTITLS